jgi:hypothetical protein
MQHVVCLLGPVSKINLASMSHEIRAPANSYHISLKINFVSLSVGSNRAQPAPSLGKIQYQTTVNSTINKNVLQLVSVTKSLPFTYENNSMN